MKKFNDTFAAAARQLSRLRVEEAGATAIEYALIASGVAVAVAATVFSLGSGVNNMFTTVANMFP